MKRRLTPAVPVLVLVAMAVATPGSPARGQDLQVVELHHRLADEVIPVVQPLLEPGGVLTGIDGLLFVRTSPANLEQIRQAVAAIDRAPRQLLISVGQGTVTGSTAAEAQGAVVIGDDSSARVQVGGREQQADLRNLSSIRTLEGSETFIAIGQSGPYRSADSGFYATARVSAETVTLEVSARQQRFAGRGGVVQSGGATSTVSVPLGEWVELGAVRESSSGSTGGLLVWGLHSGAAEYSAWLKVEEIR